MMQNTDETWIVMCERSGGHLGFAQAPLKKDGEIRYFDSQDAASAEAARLMREMNTAYAVARYRYWAEQESLWK